MNIFFIVLFILRPSRFASLGAVFYFKQNPINKYNIKRCNGNKDLKVLLASRSAFFV